ncbi:MAG: ABC transporter ATP-binding protein [Gemmatimonadales bacterium]
MTDSVLDRLRRDPRARSTLRRFAGDWVRPRLRPLMQVVVLMALLAAVTGAYPLVIKFAFDSLGGPVDGRVVWWVLAVVAVITVLRSTLLFLQSVSTSRVVLRLATDLQQALFGHLLNADYSRLTRHPPGELVSRLTSDVQVIRQACQATLSSVVRDTLSIAALVSTMFYLDRSMALVVVGVYPIAAWPIGVVTRRLRQLSHRAQAEVGAMTALLTEKLAGARLIKTFRLERYARQRLDASFERILDTRMRAVVHRSRLDPMLELLGGVAVAGVILFAYWRIASGQTSVGDFMGFLGALLMVTQPIQAVGRFSSTVGEGLAAVERMYEVLDERPTVVEAAGAPPLVVTDGTIVFDRVDFSYPGSPTPALTGLSLAIPGGRTVAVVGRSGAGKSTLVNLIPRLFDVTAGRITIDGQDIAGVSLASLRDALAMVSQEVSLFDDTIRANIRLGRLGATDAEVEAAARAAAAHAFIVEQPKGYETVIGDRGERLSGGQRQRLALARAILKQAPILLLDEATSALDSESERLVQAALARFAANRTTLIVAHRLSTIQGADLIYLLDRGAVVEAGSHETLVANGGRYAELCQLQAMGE